MGDVTEMILDGILCDSCGGYTGKACGHPTKCSSCSPKKRHRRYKSKRRSDIKNKSAVK